MKMCEWFAIRWLLPQLATTDLILTGYEAKPRSVLNPACKAIDVSQVIDIFQAIDISQETDEKTAIY